MMDYDHVASAPLRQLLLSGEGMALEEAIAYTGECLARDMVNDALDYTVLDARITAYNQAYDAESKPDAIDALRLFWS